MVATLIAEEISPASLPADPILWCRAFKDCQGLVLLDSALRHEELGRWTFLAVDPFRVLRSKNRRTELDGHPLEADPFTAVKDLLGLYPVEAQPNLPPFRTGLAGYFGYDLKRHVERVPEHRKDDIGFPDLLLGLYDLVLAVDHRDDRCWLLASGYPETTAMGRRERAQRRIVWAKDRLARSHSAESQGSWAIAAKPDIEQSTAKSMVRKTIDYIEAGDIYQANITQRFRARLPAQFDRLSLYDALRRRNPATFAAYLEFGQTAILSSSPERFLKVDGGLVETRPIKGTRPRGRTESEDSALAKELRQSEKDHAENLMIVDLLRNDLSRVCKIGSVKVPVLCGLESYSTVHHLVSVVTGELEEGQAAIDLLKAAFPGGSVTGAPKIRAMEIIAELEPTWRGPYCGSIGYLSADGAMDSNIVIRTYCVQGDELTFQVGGGIVADSDPQAEYDESLVKAKALIEVLAQGRGSINGSADTAA